MNRPHARGRGGAPLRRRHLLLAVIALVVAACGSSSAPSATPSIEPSASLPPLESLPPSTVSDAPSASAASPSPIEASASASPIVEPSPSQAAVSSSPSGGAVGLPSDCTGNANNQDFFAKLAQGVDWEVYCAVLPSGWFVDTGSFRLAHGGWMVLSYNGPAGARIELSEGAFCTEPGGCVPTGAATGTGFFGDRPGTLYAAEDGSWAIAVDPGEPISWMVVGSGLTESDFTDYAAALLQIG